MAYDNTNRGSIWQNKKKRPDKQDADFTGSLNVNGVEFWVNAWRRREDASPDAPALTFTIRPKDGQQVSTGAHSYSPGGKVKREDPISTGKRSIIPDDDMDGDSIPF